MNIRRLMLYAAVLGTLTACSDDALVGAQGVQITRVSIYQGVERVLAQDGTAATSNVPLIAGRDALVRVFYTSDRPGESVTGRLTIGTGEPIDIDATLVAESTDGDYDSTINFVLPGDLITASFDYSVGILETGGDDNPGARHPDENLEVHVVEGERNTLRLVLVPFRYDADGSGRLPDTSEAALADYRDRFLQLFPVSDVEITVREPIPWTTPIQPLGQGWQEVLIANATQRDLDSVDPEVYYYGIFDPADSFEQFCAAGCVLGVTLLNDQPPASGDVLLRMAVGLGYPQIAATTALHEIGHAHGRAHVNCGAGLDPNSIDANYPHPGTTTGVWGWDIVGEELQNPNQRADIMGYCENPWISDYNYIALHDRGQNVNASARLAAPTNHHVLALDGAGGATWQADMTRPQMGAGPGDIDVELTDASGQRWTVSGRYYAYDHLPGGLLFVPASERQPVSAEFVVNGARMVSAR